MDYVTVYEDLAARFPLRACYPPNHPYWASFETSYYRGRKLATSLVSEGWVRTKPFGRNHPVSHYDHSSDGVRVVVTNFRNRDHGLPDVSEVVCVAMG